MWINLPRVQHDWIAVCGSINLPDVTWIIDGIYCSDEAVCYEGTFGKNCQEDFCSSLLGTNLNILQYTFHWMGIFWNMISVIIVGATALQVSSSTEEGGLSSDNSTVVESLWGVFLIVLGSFIFSILCLIIEQRMKMDVPAPLLVGMMGFWGTVLCIFVIFPLGYVFL